MLNPINAVSALVGQGQKTKVTIIHAQKLRVSLVAVMTEIPITLGIYRHPEQDTNDPASERGFSFLE